MTARAAAPRAPEPIEILGPSGALEGSIEVKNIKDAAVAPVTLDAGNCAAELSAGKLTPLQPQAEQVQTYLDEVHIYDGSPNVPAPAPSKGKGKGKDKGKKAKKAKGKKGK